MPSRIENVIIKFLIGYLHGKGVVWGYGDRPHGDMGTDLTFISHSLGIY